MSFNLHGCLLLWYLSNTDNEGDFDNEDGLLFNMLKLDLILPGELIWLAIPSQWPIMKTNKLTLSLSDIYILMHKKIWACKNTNDNHNVIITLKSGYLPYTP